MAKKKFEMKKIVKWKFKQNVKIFQTFYVVFFIALILKSIMYGIEGETWIMRLSDILFGLFICLIIVLIYGLIFNLRREVKYKEV